MIVTYIYPTGELNDRRVQVRCKNPAEAIQQTGWHQANLIDLDSFLQQGEAARETCQKSDVLVIYKHLYGAALGMVEYWKARDKKVLVDFDEALDLLPCDFESRAFWTQAGPQGPAAPGRMQASPLEQFRWGLRLVDSATASTRRLAESWSSVAAIRHLPDYVNTNHYPLAASREGLSEVCIGILGQAIGAEGLAGSGLLPALEAVCALRPQVHLYFFDLPSAALTNLQIRPAQKTVLASLPYQEWPATLAGMDIGVSLVNDAYGMHSSCLPLVECMLLKIPWLASDLPPYRALGKYGWLIPNSREHWGRSLIEVIDHLEAYRQEASSEAFLYALGQDVNANVTKIIAAYQTL
jgi:hypothetical protein